MADERPAPPTRPSSSQDTQLAPEEEPVLIGALFLCMVMLILIAGAWVVMFRLLLGR